MTIAELMTRLQALEVEHGGTLPVTIGMAGVFDIKDVTVMPADHWRYAYDDIPPREPVAIPKRVVLTVGRFCLTYV